MNPVELPILRGQRITLRRPDDGDVDVRFALGIDPDIAEMFGVSRDQIQPMTRERAARQIENLIAHPARMGR